MPRTDRPYTTSRSSELARLRTRAKLTRSAAAAALEISVGGLSNIELGWARASDELLERMSGIYGVGPQTVRRAYIVGRRDFIAREKP